MGSASVRSHEVGFSLVEVLIAIGLLTTVTLGVAQLFAVAVSSNLTARAQTSTAILAAQKLEQLRSLRWSFETQPERRLPVSDTTTNLSTDPPTTTGRGLSAAPLGALDVNTPGYVDFLDANGQWVGTGARPAPGTVYIRRWSVRPLPTNPNDTVILQVLVTTNRTESRLTGAGPRPRAGDDTWLVTVKTRKAS